jgi:hypothetical protein
MSSSAPTFFLTAAADRKKVAKSQGEKMLPRAHLPAPRFFAVAYARFAQRRFREQLIPLLYFSTSFFR